MSCFFSKQQSPYNFSRTNILSTVLTLTTRWFFGGYPELGLRVRTVLVLAIFVAKFSPGSTPLSLGWLLARFLLQIGWVDHPESVEWVELYTICYMAGLHCVIGRPGSCGGGLAGVLLSQLLAVFVHLLIILFASASYLFCFQFQFVDHDGSV